MATIAKELDNRHDNKANRTSCPICSPPALSERISASRLWQWSLSHPGEPPFSVAVPSR